MNPRTLLGAALVTSVSAALAVGTQVPSYTAPDSAKSQPPAVQVDRQARSAAIDSAKDYLEDHGSLFRGSAGDSFTRVDTAAGGAGTYYVAYERTYRGLPVVGGDFVVAVNDAGKVTGRTSAQERTISLASVRPTVSADHGPLHVPRRGGQRRQGRRSPSWWSTRRASRGWPGRPWSPAPRLAPRPS